MAKSPDAFRTISEVADWLETPAHVLRFWESKFAQVKPVKRAGGRRYYRPDDMALLGGIKALLHEQGMTIKGVQKLLREKGVRHVTALSPPLRVDDVAGEPVRMPPPRRAPVRPDVEDAEIVPDAPFAEAEPPEAEAEAALLPFPGQGAEADEGPLAIGPGFERALDKARRRPPKEEADAPGSTEPVDRDVAPGSPEPVAEAPVLPAEAGPSEPLPDLVDMADAAVAGPPAADSRPVVAPAPQEVAAAPQPGLLGALMRVERGQLGPRRARLTGPAGRLAAVAERLARERG